MTARTKKFWFSFTGTSNELNSSAEILHLPPDFRDRTRIAKLIMEIFNSGAVGPSATILSRMLLQTVLCFGNAGVKFTVNVRPELSKRQCRQFCPSPIRTQLRINFPRKKRPNIFHIRQMSLIASAVKLAPLQFGGSFGVL